MPSSSDERQALVGVDRQRRRHDEQLPGHLEVDGEERAAGEVDDDLLAAPADGLDPPAGHAPDERLRVLVAQRPGPRDARAGDHRAGPAALGQQPAPEVARDGLDLGELRHRSDDRTRPAAVRCAAAPDIRHHGSLHDAAHRCRARPPRPDRRQHAVLRARRDRRRGLAAPARDQGLAGADERRAGDRRGRAADRRPAGRRARRACSSPGRAARASPSCRASARPSRWPRSGSRRSWATLVRRVPRDGHVRRDDGRGDEHARPRRPARLRALDPPAVPRHVERGRHGGRGGRGDRRGPRDRGRARTSSSWRSCSGAAIVAAYRFLLPAAVADAHPETDGVADEPVHLRHAGRLLRVLGPIAMLGILCIVLQSAASIWGAVYLTDVLGLAAGDRRRPGSSCSSRRWRSAASRTTAGSTAGAARTSSGSGP